MRTIRNVAYEHHPRWPLVRHIEVGSVNNPSVEVSIESSETVCAASRSRTACVGEDCCLVESREGAERAMRQARVLLSCNNFEAQNARVTSTSSWGRRD